MNSKDLFTILGIGMGMVHHPESGYYTEQRKKNIQQLKDTKGITGGSSKTKAKRKTESHDFADSLSFSRALLEWRRVFCALLRRWCV